MLHALPYGHGIFLPTAFPGRVVIRALAMDLDTTYRNHPKKIWPLDPSHPDNGFSMFDPPVLWLEGICASTDTVGRSDVMLLETLLLRQYPIYRMAHFDAVSGTAKPHLDYTEHLDPRHVAVLHANPQLSYLSSNMDGFGCVVRPLPL